jgi:hypothetical protein
MRFRGLCQKHAIKVLWRSSSENHQETLIAFFGSPLRHRLGREQPIGRISGVRILVYLQAFRPLPKKSAELLWASQVYILKKANQK